MTVSGYNTHITTRMFGDQAGDATFLMFRAPAVGATILRGGFVPSATFDADGSNYYTISILDGGPDGTGTTALGSYGGASVDYMANTAVSFTFTSDSVDGNDYVMVKYDETGTVAPGNITVWLEWTAGGT